MQYICEKCDEVCDIVSGDDGGFEEAYGARVWAPCPVTVSECCEEAVEEVTEEQAEIASQVNFIQELVNSYAPTGNAFSILRDMLHEARQ